MGSVVMMRSVVAVQQVVGRFVADQVGRVCFQQVVVDAWVLLLLLLLQLLRSQSMPWLLSPLPPLAQVARDHDFCVAPLAVPQARPRRVPAANWLSVPSLGSVRAVHAVALGRPRWCCCCWWGGLLSLLLFLLLPLQ
jgi:hypothetical protein